MTIYLTCFDMYYIGVFYLGMLAGALLGFFALTIFGNGDKES